MSGFSRVLTIGAVAAVVIGGIAAFSMLNNDVTADSGEDYVVLHRGNGAEPSSLDPHRASGTWENNVIGDMFLGLYTEGPDGAPLLGAAESQTVSEDGLTYTFILRDGLKWSDGEPMTAYDFEFGLRRIVDPATAARYAFITYVIENAEAINSGEISDLTQMGVHAIDDRTLEIKLWRPAPFFPWLLTHYTTFAVPRHTIEQFGDQWTRPDNMVTSGAYMLADWAPNDHITLVKNPYFYDTDNVAIDEVIYYPTDDESSALRRFRAGELDMNTGFPSQQYSWLLENMPDETHIYPYFSSAYVQFNMDDPKFADPRVRLALAMAVDRWTITEVILGTGQIPTFSLNPPMMPDYTPPQVSYAPERPLEDYTQEEAAARMAVQFEEARRLMREAGYGPERPLRFTYRYMEGIDSRRMAVAMKGWWREIYADVNIVNTEPAIHYNDLQSSNFEMGQAGWIADYPDPENYLLLFDSQAGALNYSNYYNEEFESLLAQAWQETDLEERADLYARAEAVMLNDNPFIPTYNSVSRTLVGRHLLGYEDNAVHIHRTRWMSIDESARTQQVGFVDRIMGLFN